MRMNRKLVSLAVAAALVGAAPVGHVPIATGASVQTACTPATIGGKHKCIARGQFCARRYQSDYKRYGLSCSKKDRNGRYHLR